jgi:hypothetical protein
MVKNIYKYSEINDINDAIFLVGAEHRKPIIDMINNTEIANHKKINWNFGYFD